MTAFPALPYAVVGVTGRTGAAAAHALLRAGQPVRAVVRDPAQGRWWADRGAEIAVADLTDLASMTQALSRSRGAYVVCPQHYGRDDLFELADAMAATTARAALAARVPRLVALSSVGADRTGGTGWIRMNHMLEQRLKAAGVPTVFLRAAYFMENWAPMVAQAARSGTLPSFLAPPRRALPMVATADVGSAAAALLLQGTGHWTGTRAVALAGPRDYAPSDVAAVLAATLGRPIDVATVPEAQWAQALADARFSEAALAGFTEMTRGLNASHIDIHSDSAATEQAGATPLAQVIATLAQRPG
ncbi:uncharacterized protein YbjT (DUF2867 family) [Acidovorax soli]|uniref:Uncharacterized protein YbjT (DUF2867 family) n=1 Tax=Acidovorax soli TaxID=592050 RepID=A0A7X0UCM8_9BURK|nr:NmrA family NAD(P)-binding protein [Acidovorax soli]MBB6563611.1 uncharacterized protein YbjT (DUF2867 family) [Acidovorax soli]